MKITYLAALLLIGCGSTNVTNVYEIADSGTDAAKETETSVPMDAGTAPDSAEPMDVAVVPMDSATVDAAVPDSAPASDACVPLTYAVACAAPSFQYNCGQADDGCGGQVTCGINCEPSPDRPAYCDYNSGNTATCTYCAPADAQCSQPGFDAYYCGANGPSNYTGCVALGFNGDVCCPSAE